ncbi:PEP-CTERM sorting domain-containing protein [Colwellia sp. Arc7-D]|uniref:PEP-CTERM sorting domain-containing protein n=1 Tax=Colwellia sp. Arc7-D TaxID=2161872 RepID=UPI000D3AEA42|nr:PEP-CTERM sorting domain-containing protein [Colwellia sp. Arc7-D]AWB58980.1 hypothetical protein DBO93_16405 [Colwellia sp. Arc7-D]
MIKFTLKLLFPLLLLISNSAIAGLITTDLTRDTYITYKGYDWTWASTINTTLYSDSAFGEEEDPEENTFKDADFHAGWMVIVGIELEGLFGELKLTNFTKTNGDFIHSLSYWNSIYTEVFAGGFAYRIGAKNDEKDSETRTYDTFYVRSSVAQAPAVVPEPTTLFIFGAGLLGFALRKRKIK